MNWLFKPIGEIDMLFWWIIVFVVVLNAIKFSKRRVILGIVAGAAMYFLPVITCSLIALGVGFWSLIVEFSAPKISPLQAEYRHHWYGHFAEPMFTGWRDGTSSTEPLRLPPEAIRAQARAVRVDPNTYYDDAIIFSTRVFYDHAVKKWVIEDSVVTNEKFECFEKNGYWSEPKPYKPNGYVADDGWHEGGEEFPAPVGLAAQFMSQFNGPRTQKRRRKR